jgi:hypothetical protein
MFNPILLFFTCGCVSLASVSMAEPQCHTSDAYHVVEQAFDEEPGARFAVTKLAGGAAPSDCVFDEKAADYVIGGEGDPLWFGELSGSTLVLTRSTGPQGNLVVYDLGSGEAILDAPADEYELKGKTLSYWERTTIKATAKTCPSFAENEANGMGSAIVALKTLNVETGTIKKAGERKCAATQ